MKKKPIAVLISDIHFSIKTLELATVSVENSIRTAKELGVPLVIAGDLNDTKAIIRAEVANRLVDLLIGSVNTIILVGNHDLINEKGQAHGLNYLKSLPNVTVVDSCRTVLKLLPENVHLFPYHSDPVEFLNHLKCVPKGHIIIAHQGFQGAFMGDYVQDKTSINPSLLEGYRVISGHYHKHQSIDPVTYIGSPYTMSFGEANDGPKGYLVLFGDGSYERRILSLRKHMIVKRRMEEVLEPLPDYKLGDLVWMQVVGPRIELDRLKKRDIGDKVLGTDNFKLDKYYIENQSIINKVETITDTDMLDRLIDTTPESSFDRGSLKKLWREII